MTADTVFLEPKPCLVDGLLVDALGIAAAFVTGGAGCVAGALVPLIFQTGEASRRSMSRASGEAP